MQMVKQFSKADIFAALKTYELWLYWSFQDVRLRYRRSLIGPFWITISMGIFIAALGFVYSKLFNTDVQEYLPFLAAGFITWTYISGLMLEAPNLYITEAHFIKDMRINLFILIYKLIMRHLITFAHNIVIMVGIYFMFSLPPSLNILLAIPGLCLVTLNLIAITTIISILAARFRDLIPINQSVIQVLFFVTPIFWFPRLLPNDSWVVTINPFANYLDLVRAPLLGQLPDINSWYSAGITLLILSIIATILYYKKAHRVAYWL